MARAFLVGLLLGLAAATQTVTVEEPLFLMVSQARSGTDWLIDSCLNGGRPSRTPCSTQRLALPFHSVRREDF